MNSVLCDSMAFFSYDDRFNWYFAQFDIIIKLKFITHNPLKTMHYSIVHTKKFSTNDVFKYMKYRLGKSDWKTVADILNKYNQ